MVGLEIWLNWAGLGSKPDWLGWGWSKLGCTDILVRLVIWLGWAGAGLGWRFG